MNDKTEGFRGSELKEALAGDNHLSRFVAMYASFGVELTVEVGEPLGKGFEIGMESGDEGFGGYAGFGSTVYFDTAGKFIEQDFYE